MDAALKFRVAFFESEEGGMRSEWREEVFDTPNEAAVLASNLNRDPRTGDREWLVVCEVGTRFAATRKPPPQENRRDD